MLLVQIGAQLTAAKSDSILEKRLGKIEVQVQSLTSELQEHKRRHELVCYKSVCLPCIFCPLVCLCWAAVCCVGQFLPQNDLDIPYLKSCGLLRLQNARSNMPRHSKYTHGDSRVCFLHSFMLKTRHVALLAPSMCAPQAAQGLAGAIFTLQVTPPTSPRPTLSAAAEPISRGKFPRK